MASKKDKSAAATVVDDKVAKAGSGAKKGSPTVASFLSKISTPRGQGSAASPAKGLLGGVTRDDLRNVGRFDDGHHGGEHNTAGTLDVRSDEAHGDSGRKSARIRIKHHVGVRGVFAGDVGGTDEPTTRDLSAGGVFVETANLLEVGDPVVLSFPLADGKRLVVNGRVRWVTPFGNVADPTPGMGIEFIGVDQGKRDKIEAVLASAGS